MKNRKRNVLCCMIGLAALLTVFAAGHWSGAQAAEKKQPRGRYKLLVSRQDAFPGFLIADHGWLVYQSRDGHLMACHQGKHYGVVKRGSYKKDLVYLEKDRVVFQTLAGQVWAWYLPGK